MQKNNSQPPEPPKTQPSDVINIVAILANIYAMCLTPFLRRDEGINAYAAAPFTFMLLLMFAGYIPEVGPYLPIWMIAVFIKRCMADRHEHSKFRGRQWPLGMILRDKGARSLEPCIVFAVALYLSASGSPMLADAVGGCAIAMFVLMGIELESVKGQKQRMRDARASMEQQARFMRGEDW